MSEAAPSPTSPSTNGTSKGSPPPAPSEQAPPPTASKSPPSIVSPPSTNSTSELPSGPGKHDSPPSVPSTPSPPQNNSSSVPPLLPSLPSETPPSSSAPPPEPPSENSAPPPPPAAPDQSTLPPPLHVPPTTDNSPPPPPVSPPVTPSPPAETLPVNPSPPDDGNPTLTPPAQPAIPSVPENTAGSPPSPSLPGNPPSPSSATPSTPVTTVTPSSPNSPRSRSSNHVPKLAPPSTHTGSSSTQSSNNSSDGFGSGAVVGITLAGVLIVLVAVFFLNARRKKRRRVEGLVNHYIPPNSFSVKSDGYYYRQTNAVGNASRSDAYHASISADGNTVGSYRGYASHNGPPESTGIGNSKSWFTYEEIAEMTNGFSRENLLGEGGFGCVYKGWTSDGKVVAVKQLKSGSGQGEREFRAEVEIISRVHHRHLVSLVGYCIAADQRSLVYEFVPNGTLEHHLHGKGLPVMDWPNRVRIAIGSARGLAYLHEDCHPRIIHRDIKSANILLDDSFEAQVADFGLAKLSNDTHTHVSTRVMGTFGYMAPEYASSGKLTDRSDVFSFGVVLLELITGRKPVDPSQPLGDESLVEWARPLLGRALETGNFEEVTDPRLRNNYNKSEMFRMMEAAAACVRHSAPKRPRMVQVLRSLDSEGESSDLSNGVKVGQSTVFSSGQSSADIQMFRKMAFGSEDYSSRGGYSGEYDDRRSLGAYSSGEHTGGEAPSRPLNPPKTGDRGEYRSVHYDPESRGMSRKGSTDAGSYRYNGRGGGFG